MLCIIPKKTGRGSQRCINFNKGEKETDDKTEAKTKRVERYEGIRAKNCV